MITSERQLAVTSQKIKDLRESLKKMETDAKPLTKASIVQTKVLIKELEKEVKDYETLRDKGVEAIEIKDLAEVMLLPIKYRIAKRMTQDSFAREVEVPVRMIARYESEGYRNITGENLHKILSKLHLKILGKLKEA
jgi:DNA-binding transcriptional regulator YiaG